EAPAIVTVITADDMRMWGYKTAFDVLADVPGWYTYTNCATTCAVNMVRGQPFSDLYLHDGIPMISNLSNINGLGRVLPLESIKRIEVVTGPGGVLWGANSFQGVLNVITKDADDVDGVEASAGYGDGRGNSNDFRAYGMLGQTLFGGRLKLFMHGSYENY